MKKFIFTTAICITALTACGFGPGVFSYVITNEQCRTGRINSQEAFQYFKQTADSHNTAGAQLLVARMYAQGIGTKRDIEKAKQYYQKAAQSEWRYGVNEYAQQELAELNSKGKLIGQRTVCPESNDLGGLKY